VAKVEHVQHPGAVLILPVLADGRVVLIWQYRSVIGKYIWELPAGTLEKNEDPVKCVKRELIEETGYQASKVKKIISIVPVPGYSTEVIHIYQAEGLKKVEKKSMEDEVIEEKIFTRAQVVKMLKNKEIIDAKTLCALLYYLER
jgi:ADP-ribose pyrophosphatase